LLQTLFENGTAHASTPSWILVTASSNVEKQHAGAIKTCSNKTWKPDYAFETLDPETQALLRLRN
jgi:hypothetical protein